MLCHDCEMLLSVVEKYPPGSWIGVMPKLFEYAPDQEAWTGSHHIEPGSFLSACQARCYICSTIYRDCSPELREQALSFRTFYRLKVAEHTGTLPCTGVHYELEFAVEILLGKNPIAEQQVFNCNGTFKILPKEEVSASCEPLELTPNTFSGRCENQVRHWLKNCCANHVECKQDWRSAGRAPSRLLKVHPDMGNQVQLENFTQNDHPPSYVTLSHCWGAGMTETLKLDNERRLLRRPLLIESLPKTFQDAVAIARWMHIDYIWIDALCIIQDSDDDWLVEAARMGDYYTNSYCNIAATSTAFGKGCFTDRYVSMVEPYIINNPRQHENTKTHIIGYDDFWCNSLLDTALHKRGWVLQERLLSARTIHFGQEQIFWECRCKMACEAYPDGILEQFSNRRTRGWRRVDYLLGPEKKPKRMPTALQALPELRRIYEIWSKVIEAYMDCKLSFDKDKLVAISGIAQRVAALTGERYLAGLWDNSMLAPSLLWYVLGRRQADSTPSLRRLLAEDHEYRAPSWSWASLEAKIIWNWPVECGEVLIKISKIDVLQAKGSKLGKVSNAQMKIRCCLFQAKLSIVNQTPDGVFEEDGSYALEFEEKKQAQVTAYESIKQSRMEPTIYLDTPLMPKRTSIDVYLMPVCTDWRGRSVSLTTRLAGLLLRKIDSGTSEAKFERLGIFGMDQIQLSMLYGAQHGESGFSDKRLSEAGHRTVVLL